MSNDQIYEFTQRFESKAVNHHMSFKNYKDSLGLIGVDSLSFLADRMFAVMDENSKGYVSFALMLTPLYRSRLESTSGTSTLCFTAPSKRSSSKASSCSMNAERGGSRLKTSTKWCNRSPRCGQLPLASQVSASSTALTPLHSPHQSKVRPEHLQQHGLRQIAFRFDQQDFMLYMKENLDFLLWFSKPEKTL